MTPLRLPHIRVTEVVLRFEKLERQLATLGDRGPLQPAPAPPQ